MKPSEVGLGTMRHIGMVVAAYEAGNGPESNSPDEFQKLIGCLNRHGQGSFQSGNGSAVVDADVQSALAVLLNTNEVESNTHTTLPLIVIIQLLGLQPSSRLLPYSTISST